MCYLATSIEGMFELLVTCLNQFGCYLYIITKCEILIVDSFVFVCSCLGNRNKVVSKLFLTMGIVWNTVVQVVWETAVESFCFGHTQSI